MLFGASAHGHDLFAPHVAHSEAWVETSALGGVVHEWSPRPTRLDNHWFEFLVGCAVAVAGCSAKAAIKAHSLGCCGWARSEVAACTALAFPLWGHRPFKK